MKIAIASAGKDMDAAVDNRFGRASAFVVYDTETDSFEAVDNMVNLNAAQGAGIQTAQNVASTGARVVLASNYGPKAVQVLKAAGIRMYITAASTVREAVREYTDGTLKETEGANVRSHWQ